MSITANMPAWLLWVLRYLAIIVCCGVLPALGLRLFMRALPESSAAQVKNYAGRMVPLGLGMIWPLWVGGFLIFQIFFGDVRLQLMGNSNAGTPMMLLVLLGYVAAVLAAFGFGLLDDTFGSGDARGFKGHFKVLAHGRLTTGIMKLFGIGFASLFLALCLHPFNNSWELGWWSFVLWLLTVLVAGAATALCANFVNLCDLRPGRAGKTSILILIVGLALSFVKSWYFGLFSGTTVLLTLRTFLAFLLPMLVTLPADLRERGMLGDAGANPAGLIAGGYLTTQLGLVGLIVFFALMLALNLSSEKISFSRVIEKISLLSWLDQIGRIKKEKLD